MTDNRTTEQTATDRLRAMLDERGVKYEEYSYMTPGSMIKADVTRVRDYMGKSYIRFMSTSNPGMLDVAAQMTPEQAIAATLGSDDRYDAGFASGVQAVFQQLEGIEDYEELQCFIAEYWGEGEGNDER